MPETIILEDGTEREIPTSEELQALQSKAEQAAQLEILQKELGLSEGDSLVDNIKELKESANPNWPAAREKMKKLQQLAKEKGINVDENGNIVDGTVIRPEELDERIQKKSAEISFNNKLDEVLSKYKNDDERKVVEHYLGKLMTGEEKTIGNLLKFQEEAERLAFPDRQVDPLKRVFNATGGAPRSGPQPGQPSQGAVEMGRVFGIGEDKFKTAGDVSDLILNK